MSSETPLKPTQINVRGTKVALGPFLREHVDLMYGFNQDPEVEVYGNGTFEPRSLEQHIENFEKIAKGTDYAGFAIFELEKLTLIGDVGLRHISHLHGTATLGIGIGRKEYWGKGYGTEAVKLTLDYGFRFLNLHNIDLDTNSFNTRAQRSYEKAGFKVIGRRRGATVLNGQRYDVVYMDCLAAEFEAPNPGWFTLPAS